MSFDFKKYMMENRLGPYSKDATSEKQVLKESDHTHEKTEESIDEAQEENPWMQDIDGTEAYKVGDWTCHYVYPGILLWSHLDTPLENLSVAATPNFDGDGTTPIQLDVNETTQWEETINKSEFADFNEYAAAVKPYLDEISSRREKIDSVKLSTGDISEAPKPPAPEDVYADDESEQDVFDRAWGIAGNSIKQAIDDLRADGFDDEDIKNLMWTAVEMYDQAFTNETEGAQ